MSMELMHARGSSQKIKHAKGVKVIDTPVAAPTHIKQCPDDAAHFASIERYSREISYAWVM